MKKVSEFGDVIARRATDHELLKLIMVRLFGRVGTENYMKEDCSREEEFLADLVRRPSNKEISKAIDDCAKEIKL